MLIVTRKSEKKRSNGKNFERRWIVHTVGRYGNRYEKHATRVGDVLWSGRDNIFIIGQHLCIFVREYITILKEIYFFSLD